MDSGENNNSNINANDVSPMEIGKKNNSDDNVELVENDDGMDDDTSGNGEPEHSMTTNLNINTNKTESVAVSRKKRRKKKCRKNLPTVTTM